MRGPLRALVPVMPPRQCLGRRCWGRCAELLLLVLVVATRPPACTSQQQQQEQAQPACGEAGGGRTVWQVLEDGGRFHSHVDAMLAQSPEYITILNSSVANVTILITYDDTLSDYLYQPTDPAVLQMWTDYLFNGTAPPSFNTSIYSAVTSSPSYYSLDLYFTLPGWLDAPDLASLGRVNSVLGMATHQDLPLVFEQQGEGEEEGELLISGVYGIPGNLTDSLPACNGWVHVHNGMLMPASRVWQVPIVTSFGLDDFIALDDGGGGGSSSSGDGEGPGGSGGRPCSPTITSFIMDDDRFHNQVTDPSFATMAAVLDSATAEGDITVFVATDDTLVTLLYFPADLETRELWNMFLYNATEPPSVKASPYDSYNSHPAYTSCQLYHVLPGARDTASLLDQGSANTLLGKLLGGGFEPGGGGGQQGEEEGDRPHPPPSSSGGGSGVGQSSSYYPLYFYNESGQAMLEGIYGFPGPLLERHEVCNGVVYVMGAYPVPAASIDEVPVVRPTASDVSLLLSNETAYYEEMEARAMEEGGEEGGGSSGSGAGVPPVPPSEGNGDDAGDDAGDGAGGGDDGGSSMVTGFLVAVAAAVAAVAIAAVLGLLLFRLRWNRRGRGGGHSKLQQEEGMDGLFGGDGGPTDDDGDDDGGGGGLVSAFANVSGPSFGRPQEWLPPLPASNASRRRPPGGDMLKTRPMSDDSQSSDDGHRNTIGMTPLEVFRAQQQAAEPGSRSQQQQGQGQKATLGVGEASAGQRSPHLVSESPFSWELLPQDVELLTRADGQEICLGAGAFGQVFRGVMLGSVPVAVKYVTHAANKAEQVKQLVREISLLKECRNNNVVQFYGGYIRGEALMLVTEYMRGGDLYRALHEKANSERWMWHKQGKAVALDVIRGLSYLHSKRIVHCDLKTPNVLLGVGGFAKIGDLGMSQLMVHDHVTKTQWAGTLSWAAPEMLLNSRVTEKVDIYSFGVVLWEIITGEVPLRGQMRMLSCEEDGIPQEVVDLYSACIDSDPAVRPTAQECCAILQAAISAVARAESHRGAGGGGAVAAAGDA